MAGFGGIKKVKCAAAKPVFFCLCKKAHLFRRIQQYVLQPPFVISHIFHFLVSFKQCSLYTAL